MKGVLKELLSGETAMAVIGLGYVGFPLAKAFARKFSVIGLDVDERKLALYRQEYTLANNDSLSENIEFTSETGRISNAKCIIIAVPTPIYGDKTPDLDPLKKATETVGRYLSRDSIVIYESTVYPGVTEEICLPILEHESGLKCGSDFKVGYSPERINPGDKINKLENIVKIVSGIDNGTLTEITGIYETIVRKVYPVPSIKVAEAAKLAENAQRDINIAFMNELATVFHLMNIDTEEVVRAMDTKWNALRFRPGLVGGHCIGIDPYYFIYKAQNLGYYSQITTAARRINNGMSDFVVNETLKLMIKAGINMAAARVVIMGMTFKENCPDTRNSRAIDIYYKFKQYGFSVLAVDPLIEKDCFAQEYGIELIEITDVCDADCLVFLVAHDNFVGFDDDLLRNMFRIDSSKNKVLIDVKGIFSAKAKGKTEYVYWSL